MDNSKYFANTACPYFPCHEGADPNDFNCLFCYCPLYALGEACGGTFCYTREGIKDCSRCLLPHRKAGFEHVMQGCEQVIKRTQGRRPK